MDRPIRILFIKPYIDTPNQAIEIPMGLLYLSAYLRQQLGDQAVIEILDLRFGKDKKAIITQKFAEFKPDVIGIGMLSFEDSFLEEYFDTIRQKALQAKIIVGGPYGTYNYADALTTYDIECAVAGEGERVMANLIRCFMKGADISGVKGIAYRNGEEVICNEREDYIEDLDLLPVPAYDLIDFKRYWRPYKFQMNVVLAEKRYALIISSRACPYKCLYCHGIFGSKLRKRSPEHFVSEIKMLYDKYGIREFQIVDDVFNLDRKRLHAIMHQIIESKLKIKIAFPNGLRGDVLEEEDLLLMKKAGVYMVTVAIESATPRIQKMIKKDLNIEKVMKRIAFANKIGLITRGFFMIGFPGETVEEMKATVRLAAESKLDMAAFSIVVPFPGTGLYELTKNMYKDFDIDKCFARYYGKSFYEALTGYNTEKLRKYAHLRFYSPLRLARLFYKVPHKIAFMYKWFCAGLGVLKV